MNNESGGKFFLFEFGVQFNKDRGGGGSQDVIK